MADHAHSQEDEEKDRLFITLVVLGVALVLALGAWKDGGAAPEPRARALPGGERASRVVRVQRAGQDPVEYRGLVLQRGASIHVVTASGEEIVLPRSADVTVLTGDEPESTQAPIKEAAPRARQTSAAPTQGQGFVVNRDGHGFSGRLEISADRIVVHQSDRSTVSIPRADVRWHKLGVKRPDQSYYDAFPGLPVEGYPASNRDERIARAEIAFTDGQWSDAFGFYLELHREGYEVEDNLRRAAQRWAAQGSYAERQNTIRGLGTQMRQAPEVKLLRRIYADALYALGMDACRSPRQRALVEEAIKELRGLGPEYAPAAQKIESQLRLRQGR